MPYVRSVARKAERVDIVFDTYIINSLKSTTREKRGTGIRTLVTAATKTSQNLQAFLRVDDNKSDLIHFSANLVCETTDICEHILVTYDERIRCNTYIDKQSFDPCSHEEVDTRPLLHCSYAARNGAKKVAIRTVDTDVVVLALAFFAQLGREELWINFGVGKYVRVIAAHNIASSLGVDKSRALPVFHAITGCDTTSCFSHRGKKCLGNMECLSRSDPGFLELCDLQLVDIK